MSEHRRVVITGMGVVTPLGIGVDTYWDGVVSGKSGIGPIERFSVEGFDVRIGGECRDFNPDNYFDRKAAKRLDRFAQFALVATTEAINASGLDLKSYSGGRERLGVAIGSGIGGLMEFEEQHCRLIDRGPTKLSPFTIPKLMINAAAGNIAIEFGLKGHSSTVASACASAAHAMGEAFNTIRENTADVMITGGSEAALTPLGLAAFAAMKALSTRNDEPQIASRPFDKDRDGFVLSEGAGMLIFEELEHAKARGAKIWAEVLGFGASSDAGHITQPVEDGAGAAAAMLQCLANANTRPEDVQYLNAHGTATGLGDTAEIKAIKRAFGPAAGSLAVSSTKSCIGHLLGASGGAELIATIMAMNSSMAPPTINLDNPEEGCDLDLVPHKAKDLKIEKAISNSFGFGGHNASLMVGRYD